MHYIIYVLYIVYPISVILFHVRSLTAFRAHDIQRSRNRAVLSRFGWTIHLCCPLTLSIFVLYIVHTNHVFWQSLTELRYIITTTIYSRTVFLLWKTMLCFARDILYNLLYYIIIIIVIAIILIQVILYWNRSSKSYPDEIDTRDLRLATLRSMKLISRQACGRSNRG